MPSATSRDTLTTRLNYFIAAAIVLTIFFILTQGIPFVQLGWMPPLAKKSHYNNLLRTSVVVCAVIVLLIRIKFPKEFEQIWLGRFVSQFSSRQMWVGGTVLYALYCINFFFIGNLRHDALQTRAFDLGIFSQAIWTTLNGKFLFSSLKEHICLLGDHFSPLLLITVPFYALWQDPRCLLLIQTLSAAAIIFPIIHLAHRKTRDPWIAFIFALMFFFYLPTRSALRDDFHPEIMVEALIICALIAIESKKWLHFSLLALLIVSAKENMPGVVFILGVYAFVFKKQRIAGAAIAATAVGVFILITRLFIPALNPDGYFYTGNFTALTGPLSLLKLLLSKDTTEYLLAVFLPFSFLPLLHPPTLLLTLPIILQNTLSSNGVMRSMNYHYLAGLSGFLFASSIFAFAAITDRFAWFNKHKRVLATFVLTIALLRSGASEYYFFWTMGKEIQPDAKIIREKLSNIPASARVITHNNLVAQLPNRFFVYQFDYNEVLTKPQEAQKRNADYAVLCRYFWEGRHNFEDTLASFLSAGYITEFQSNNFVVFKSPSPHEA